jgi:hypothetical protein
MVNSRTKKTELSSTCRREQPAQDIGADHRSGKLSNNETKRVFRKNT